MRWLLTALMLLPASAEAHRGSVQRTMLVEPAGEELQVVFHLKLPSTRKKSIYALADGDHNGRLSEKERDRLSLRLADRAMDGVRLYVGTSSVVLRNVETKIKVKRAVELMVHGVVPLPRSRDPLPLEVRLTERSEPLVLVLVPGTRPYEKSRAMMESNPQKRLMKNTFQRELKGAGRFRWRLQAPR